MEIAMAREYVNNIITGPSGQRRPPAFRLGAIRIEEATGLGYRDF
jgi:hypothetical protein